tara:strand:- start:543 stop:2258 length:1716 start_codon:yes stop_codon:yes gene_type:complete
MAERIPKEFIDHLLEKVNIVDVIGGYVKLEKKGNDYWARCPFHNEKTSSFSVSESKQFYHCFGCGAHGNAIGFIMEHANKTYVEAIEEIANLAGVEVPRSKESNEKFEARKTIQDALEDAKKLFEDNLKKSKQAISYLQNRNISGVTSKLFGIGYSIDNFQNLSKTLRKNYSEKNLIDAGLLVRKEKNSYDKFRNRIMFPIYDVGGRVIAFGGRDISNSNNTSIPKYMNSPETNLFSKKKVLYNLHLAKTEKVAKDFLFIVEGYMDVVALHQAGIKNVVATLGTAVTTENLEQCFRYTKEIICCFDGDKAGQDAAWKGVNNIMSIFKDGNEINFIFFPDGKDPDDIVNNGGKDLWHKYTKDKISIEDYIHKKLSSEINLNSAAGKTQYLKKVDDLLRPLKAPIFRKMLHQSLSSKVNSENSTSKYDNKTNKSKTSTKIANTPLQRAILILLHHPSIKIDYDLLEDKRIAHNPGIELIKEIVGNIRDNNSTNMGRILESFRDNENDYKTLEKISIMKLANLEWPDKEFNACLCLTIKNFLQERLDNADPQNLNEFLNIQKEIHSIKEKSKNY